MVARRTLTLADITLYIIDCQSAATFKQMMPFPSPSLLQVSRSDFHSITIKVIQHYDVSSSFDSFICLLLALNLNFNLDSKTTNGPCSFNSFGYRPWRKTG